MYNCKNKVRLGLYEKATPASLSWLERLNVAKELGFDFLEISVDETDDRRARLDWSDDEIYQLRHQCEQTGIPLQSMCLSAHRKFPYGSADPKIRAEAERIMEKAISLAYKLGVRTIQLAGYDVYYEKQTEETHQRFIEGMKSATKLAEQAGVMLAVEIMDTPYLNSLGKFEILKREIPSPYFMAYPDVGNINGWNFDVSNELTLARDHLVQIHLKNTLKVTNSTKGLFRDLVIGEGQVEFVPIFQTLKKINYQGPFVIEMWAQDDKWQENIVLAKQRLLDAAKQADYNLQ